MRVFVIIIVPMISAMIATVITASVMTARYLKLLDNYIDENLKMTKDLINWSKGLDKFE